MVANADAGLTALERVVEAAAIGLEGDAPIQGSGQHVGQVLVRLHLAHPELGLVLAPAPHPVDEHSPVSGDVVQAHVRGVVGAQGVRVQQDLVGGATPLAGVQDREVVLHSPFPEEVAPPAGEGQSCTS